MPKTSNYLQEVICRAYYKEKELWVRSLATLDAQWLLSGMYMILDKRSHLITEWFYILSNILLKVFISQLVVFRRWWGGVSIFLNSESTIAHQSGRLPKGRIKSIPAKTFCIEKKIYLVIKRLFFLLFLCKTSKEKLTGRKERKYLLNFWNGC